jgi:hypothetical protein
MRRKDFVSEGSHRCDWCRFRISVSAGRSGHTNRLFAAGGGLIVLRHRAGGVICRSHSAGARSREIFPVQSPTRFELVINLKTAKALSLTIPLPLLGLAQEVIE